MSAGKHPKKKSQELSFDSMVSFLRSTMAGFPDKRTGSNCHYSIETAALGAFSVFFTQSPSFLAFQTTMLKHTGISNAQTLFDMDEIPSDNHIRNLMDEVAPSNVYPVFHYIFKGIKDSGQLNSFRSYDNHLLCALDGTSFFSSDNRGALTHHLLSSSKANVHKNLHK
jgi:hypothetical protein